MGERDSKLDRMMREEKERWLKSCGAAGGSLTEFQAHLAKLVETDSEWRDAAIEKSARWGNVIPISRLKTMRPR